MRPLWEAIQDNDEEVLAETKKLTAIYSLCDVMLECLGIIPDISNGNPAKETTFYSPMSIRFEDGKVKRDERSHEGYEPSSISTILQSGAKMMKRKLKEQGLTLNCNTTKGKYSDDFSINLSIGDMYLCKFTINLSKNTAYLSDAMKNEVKTVLYDIASLQVFVISIYKEMDVDYRKVYQYLVDNAKKVIR